MTVLRRHLRLWALTWLILQAGSLAAFVPRDCCAAHRPAAATKTCHETPPTAHCPMRDGTGEPCPMHRPSATTTHAGHHAEAAHVHDAEQPTTDNASHSTPTERCVMRGSCQGVTFASVLSYPGILPDSLPAPVRLALPAPPTDLRQQTLSQLVAPDPHPPRA